MKMLFSQFRRIGGAITTPNLYSKLAISLLALLAALPSFEASAKVAAPTFTAPWLSFNTGLNAAAGSPVALATGDADGDGDRDIVATR
ncbi:MAG: hypothetical protein M3Q46_05540, partial [Verrucomicrobiota bacterium]|nr:hypothetical protein [Verrucomicrobiota bacterium]